MFGALALVALGALALAFHFYGLSKNPDGAPSDEAGAVVAKVGKLLILPLGEEPTVATVSDANALRDQPFFAYAEAGDQVLIYTKAKKAILYRPSLNKLVEVSAITTDVPAKAE
jgi:hypothetical protein